MKEKILIGLLLLRFLIACNNLQENRGTELKLNHGLDSSVINNPNLFHFEFTILNMHSEESVDSINRAISQIRGVMGYETKLQTATCLVYADSLDKYEELMNAIAKAGYRIEKTFSLGGPGLTCDIAPNDKKSHADSINLESLEKSVLSFKEKFNLYRKKVRIVSIPNPACLACVKGQRFINDLFIKEFPSDTNLIGFIDWISIDGWGKLKDVTRLAPEINDKRVFHYWDPIMKLGKLYKIPINLDKNYMTAWDVYLVYKPGVIWEKIFRHLQHFGCISLVTSPVEQKKNFSLKKRFF